MITQSCSIQVLRHKVPASGLQSGRWSPPDTLRSLPTLQPVGCAVGCGEAGNRIRSPRVAGEFDRLPADLRTFISKSWHIFPASAMHGLGKFQPSESVEIPALPIVGATSRRRSGPQLFDL